MKGTSYLTMLAFVVLFLLPSFAPAQSYNTLEWGVEIDEEFTYALQRKYLEQPDHAEYLQGQLPFIVRMEEGQKLIARITELKTIPSLINDSSQVPRSYCDLSRENDSEMIVSNALNFAVPIGDWDFLAEIGNVTAQPEVILIDNEEEWGTIGTGSFAEPGGSTVTVYIEIRYEKENGTLSYIRHRYSTLGNDLADVILAQWHPGMPTILPPELQLSTVLLVLSGITAGIIAAMVVYQWYRRKKPVVQELGE